jgi:sulfur carrier protein
MPAKGKVKKRFLAFLPDPAPLLFTRIVQMNVFVNNQQLNLNEGSTLQSALDFNGLQSARGIAVAVNNQVVPRSEWINKKLTENDKITVIRATQGG